MGKILDILLLLGTHIICLVSHCNDASFLDDFPLYGCSFERHDIGKHVRNLSELLHGQSQ